MTERKIVDYTVEMNDNIEDLTIGVLQNISDGYVLQGGICVSVEYDGTTWFYQAMVKYEE